MEQVSLKAVSNTDLLKMYIDHYKRLNDLKFFMDRDLTNNKQQDFVYHSEQYDEKKTIFNNIEREILSRMMGMEID